MLRIKEVIKEKGLTVQTVAERMGINRVNLSAAINGNPTYKTLENIASALDVEVVDLFEKKPVESTALNCPHCGKPINIKIE